MSKTLPETPMIGDVRATSGVSKTWLMHRLLAAALNFMRVAAWLADIP
jgi:hypothetical protein